MIAGLDKYEADQRIFEMKVKVYREIYDGSWSTSLRPFKPTGRWMIKTINHHTSLYLEHKGWLFNSWWHENRLIVREEEYFINKC